jgi:hypothetical protein
VEKSTPSTPRFPFVASAEILPEMGPGVGATVKEISLYGCFLEFTNPYPTRTRVTVKIFSESSLFEAKGAVIYAKPDVGMGVAKSPLLWLLGAVLVFSPRALEIYSRDPRKYVDPHLRSVS